MQRKTILFFTLCAGALLAAAAGLWLAGTTPASAQCGSQASSCKNCHEVQAKMPVNSDGTPWHTAHAFGDFCYICHAGNNQASDQTLAHTGMVPPLSDVDASCLQCHPADAKDLALTYANVLGVEIGSGGAASAPPTASEGQTGAPPAEPPAAAAPPALVVDNDQVVDYNQVYDETVLGKRTINYGNLILWFMVAGLLVGGGAFVYVNERKLRGLPIGPSRQVESKPSTAEIPVVPGYSVELAELLPLAARLNPVGLHSLKKLLTHPEQADELLHNLAQLDPDTVMRVRGLDRSARELLLAILGR